MSRAQRRAMVERDNPVVPVFQQCRLLAVPRSAVYRKPAEVSAEDLALMALIDRQYLARPYYPKSGSWMIARWRRIGRNHRDGDGEDEFGGSPRG